MANRFHGNRIDEPPMANVSRGLNARVAQVRAANREVDLVRGENTGRGMTGMVAVKKQREVAERALERQIRYQRGQYPVR